MKFKITRPTIDNEYGDIIELNDAELIAYPYNSSLERVEFIEKSETVSYVEEDRVELKKLKMKELRKIGDSYGVKDTKKSELIEEIIQEKIQRGEL